MIAPDTQSSSSRPTKHREKKLKKGNAQDNEHKKVLQSLEVFNLFIASAIQHRFKIKWVTTATSLGKSTTKILSGRDPQKPELYSFKTGLTSCNAAVWVKIIWSPEIINQDLLTAHESLKTFTRKKLLTHRSHTLRSPNNWTYPC